MSEFYVALGIGLAYLCAIPLILLGMICISYIILTPMVLLIYREKEEDFCYRLVKHESNSVTQKPSPLFGITLDEIRQQL